MQERLTSHTHAYGQMEPPLPISVFNILTWGTILLATQHGCNLSMAAFWVLQWSPCFAECSAERLAADLSSKCCYWLCCSTKHTASHLIKRRHATGHFSSALGRGSLAPSTTIRCRKSMTLRPSHGTLRVTSSHITIPSEKMSAYKKWWMHFSP